MDGCKKVLVFIKNNAQAIELSDELSAAGISSVAVFDGKELLQKLLYDDIWLLIIDVDIDSENQYSIEKYLFIRQKLLVIGVSENVENSLSLLRIGVDRFLMSPFENSIMIANVQALLRTQIKNSINENTHMPPEGTVWKLISDGWFLVSPNKSIIKLTAREFRFFEILFMNQGKIVAKNELIKYVIGRNYDNSNHRLNLMITRLRKKIQTEMMMDCPIKTEYTVGYSFTSPGTIQ